MAEKLVLELSLEGKIDKNAQNKLQTQSKKAGNKAGKNLEKGLEKGGKKGIASVGSSLKSLGIIAAGIGIAKIFTAGINAAKVQEDAVNKLNTALQITGKFSLKASQDLQEYASSLQLVTKFGDEVILESQALIQSLGNLSKGELKRATKASLDLAAALGIDLRTAATLVGKAAAGEVGSFSRYGLSIKKAETNAKTLTNTLDALESKFGGSAEKQVNTFSGATEQLGNSFGDLLEGFGFFITQNPLIVSALKSTTSFIATLGYITKTTAGSINDFFGDEKEQPALKILDAQILASINKIQKLQGMANENAGNKFGEGILKNIVGLQRVEKGLIRRRKAMVDSESAAEKAKIKEEELAAAEEARIEKSIALQKTRAAQLGIIGLTETQALQQQQNEQIEILKAAHELKLIDSDAFNERKLESQTIFNDRMADIEAAQQMNSEATFSNIAESFKNLQKNVKVTSGGIAKIADSVLAGGLGKAFSSMGASMAKGEDAMASFAQGIKNIFGQLASALGDYYIKSGIAELALTSGAKGASTVAAGAGLKILAGAMGASGGGAGVSSSSSSGTSSTSPVIESNNAALEEQDLAEEKQNIQLVVNGDVFNTEETGRTLLNIFNDNFDNTGASLTNAKFA